MKKLKFIHITHTALTQVPMIPFTTAHVIDIVDFEASRITAIQSNTFFINANRVNLDNNLIERVDDYAFNGSWIHLLSLKGNTKLTHLSHNCFSGIKHLKILDLSATSITKLPTNGLANLSILRLVNTYTLKVIPSVYSFNHIEKAELTYPYHCCAFKHPKTHDQYNLLTTKHACPRTRDIIEKKKHSHKSVNVTAQSQVKSSTHSVSTATVSSDVSSDHTQSHSYTSVNHKYHWITTLVPKWIVKLVRPPPQVRHTLPLHRVLLFHHRHHLT